MVWLIVQGKNACNATVVILQNPNELQIIQYEI